MLVGKKGGGKGLREVKAERVRRGLTQVEMADVVGIGVRVYRAKENGYRKFNGKEMLKIADCFGWDMKKLGEVFLKE